MKYLVIFLVLMGFALTPYLVSNSFAICVINEDWSDAPCYTKRGEDPSLNQMKRWWSQYYEFKGTEWMESKKLELMQAIQNGNLFEWKKEDHDSSHHNVYMYYFLIGDIPNEDELFAEEYYGVRVLSPQQQSASGIPFSEIHCGIDLILIQKYDDSPACVTEQTRQKLIERGWVSNEFLESIMNTFTLDTEKGIFEIQYFITGAESLDISSDVDINSVVITLDKSKIGHLTIALPKPLANLILGYCDKNYNKNVDPTFFILVDGKEVEFNIMTSDQEQILIIPFQEDTRKIEITVGCLI